MINQILPERTVTLLELLRFHADAYIKLVARLKDLHVNLSFVEAENRFGSPLRAQASRLSLTEAIGAQNLLKVIQKHCEELGLDLSRMHAQELAEKTEWEASDISGLERNIERELSLRIFISIDPKKIQQFSQPQAGWENIISVFPGAVDDIEEMNRCFSLCRYAAAVIHSLLVVEHGLIKLGNILNVTDHKAGWDASCKELEKIVKAGYGANKTGLDFSFLEQANACVQSMKHAWRNKVNHAVGKPIVMSGGFSPEVSEEIIIATRSFMRRLSEGLTQDK